MRQSAAGGSRAWWPSAVGRRAGVFALLALLAAAPHGAAQLGGPPPPDPRAVLAQAKAASGGAAWDALRTQHSKVTLMVGSLTGHAERWSDIVSGHYAVVFTLGPARGATGYDAQGPWVQDAAGETQDEPDATARELAVNASYRDRLAFWYPERARARITYKERAEADGAVFDVIRITPEGGRPFELWINTETHLVERLVEREAIAVRTERYMDLREVQGVLVPFRMRASRDRGQHDELVTVDDMTFDAPLPPGRLTRPPPPAPDFTFPAGRDSVEVPFDFVDGHVFVHALVDGRRVRLLVDSGGSNVLLPNVAAAVGARTAAGAAGDMSPARVKRLNLGGVVFERQAFTTLDLAAFLQRAEGADDIGGVLGAEIFRRVVVSLDYTRLRATLHDPDHYRPKGGAATLPLVAPFKTPRVEGRIDGTPGVFRVDTGSRGSLTLNPSFAAAHGFADRPHGIAAVIGASVTGPVHASVWRAAALTLGDIDVAGPITAVLTRNGGVLTESDAAGNIGNGILRRFNVVFDLPHRSLHLERNAAFAAPDVYDRAGLWIERSERGLAIVDVVQDGPAAGAGLAPGDVIVAIDGARVAATSLAAVRDKLRGPPGRTIRLTLESGASKVLTLRDLL